MNKNLCSITLFLGCATSALANVADAQTNEATRANQSNSRSPYGPYRYTGGWNVSGPQNPNPRSDAELSAVVQAAFYQAPGSGMGLPAFPGNEGNAPASNYPNGGGSGLPLPLPSGMPNSMPNALSAGQGNVMPGRLSDVEVPNNMPPQNYPLNNQQVIPPQQQFDPYAREQQQVLPPSQMQSPYRTASTDLRAVQNNNPQNPPQQNPGNDLRPVAPTMQRGFGASAQQLDVASGYPFVSPAPRTGNYPTSQYNAAVFRPVSYQSVVQSPQAPLSAAVANTQPTLPQFQNPPAAGVYPTQYQCAPGTATYPPPGMVPGTYVPPTLTPNLTPGTYSPNNSGYSPVFSLGQENYNVQIGRGIIGQPTVYVPGQPFRNFIRYLSP